MTLYLSHLFAFFYSLGRIVLNQQGGAVCFFVAAELIARYCDTLLRKSSKNTTEVEEKLDGAIKVFRFLDDKDVFQRFYSRMMAKRLIHKQSIGPEVETSVVNKLRDACGCDYTGKLMRMQRDITTSAQVGVTEQGDTRDVRHS